MFQADVLRWKCFAPHPFWEGSRGYALRHKGGIAAFGCVVPLRFLTSAGAAASCNVIDWAASKAVPGAGILLYRHIQELAGAMINIGGSTDAFRVLPSIGFQTGADRHNYRRVLRPWRYLRRFGQKDWKAPLRLARDYRALARRGAAANRRDLEARRLASFDAVTEEVFPDPSIVGRAVCARTAQSLNYFLACPAAHMEAYLLERGHAPAGYFVLSRVGGRCRIADLWIRSADPLDWAAAYLAATDAACADPDLVEVTAAVCAPFETGALERAGYRRTHAEPVFVLDRDRRLGDKNDLSVTLLENDGFYWREPGA